MPPRTAKSADPQGGTEAADASDEDLMLRYQGGDTVAFDMLFQRHAGRVFRYFRQGAASVELAEDLTQQVWLQIHRAKHSFVSGARFRPWFYAIAANLRRDNLRSLRRNRADLTSDGSMPEHMPISASTDGLPAAVGRALAQLPDTSREVILLHRFADLELAEIAEVLDTTVGAVKLRAYRGYVKLRELLADWRMP